MHRRCLRVGLRRRQQVDVPAEERTKPSCCDDEGAPPVDGEAACGLADAIERSARHARRAAETAMIS